MDQKEPQRVGSVGVDHLHGVGVVSEALAHLLAVRRQHQSRYYAVPERGLFEERRRQHREGIKPAPGLVQAFVNKVRGEVAVEVLPVFVGIVILRVGHGAGLKPAVQHFRDSAHDAATGTGNSDVVNKVFVQIRGVNSAQFFELRPASHTDGFAAVRAFPDGQGVPPVAAPADGPVPGALQPLPEASALDVLRHPVDLVVCVQHILLDLLDVHKPGAHRPVDQGVAAAPAMGIGVEDLFPPDQLPLRLEPFHDGPVRVLHKEALVVAHLRGKPALLVDGADHRDPGAPENPFVVLPKARRGVDYAGAVGGGHEVPRIDPEGVLFRQGGKIGKQGLVLCARQVRPFHFLEDVVFGGGFIVGRKPRLREDVVILPVPDQTVVNIRPHGQGEVGGQGPGRGGPGQEIRVGRKRRGL